MAAVDPAQVAFEEAQQEFRKKLNNSDLYKEILTTTTVREVQKASRKIQEAAAGKGSMRRLQQIQPFLDRLEKFTGVIEVFIQVKPELLALIWGPIKLLLLYSNQVTTGLQKMADAMEKIGHALPQFHILAGVFKSDEAVKMALVLFYKDVLEFLRINLDFFHKTRWKHLFDVLWRNHEKQIEEVASKLDKHSALVRAEVTVIDLKEALEARTEASAHFAETRVSEQLQRYHNLKSRISPDLYDDRLHWLRNESVADCANWIFRHGSFSEWLDVLDKTNNWLWIKGIPGAGKTYLCAAVIEYVKGQHQVLFAFVSHANKTSLKALSVIQSFIFQVAEDDEDFRCLLIESKERELCGNTGYVVELLKGFLKTAEPTYIIVDGLDEMEECERQILLQRLDELSTGCSNLRPLICSRAEADISKVLEDKAKYIRVHDMNSGSIQKYVDCKSKAWMASCHFGSKIESELLGLLSPLAANAKGMFLYARIILGNLEHMSSINEIRSELKALPIDLNDAYHRIFQRINDSHPMARDKCRRVLGWIGCAPIPLTTFEMEQALSINLRDDNPSNASNFLSLNFVRLCGPIIEIVDQKLQFVHFTVQEYIFSNAISDFIDKTKATTELAASFLTYLSSGVLDPDLDDEDIEKNILSGKYRLFEYAGFYWPKILHHIDNFHKAPGRKTILRKLDQVIQRCGNDDFEEGGDGSPHKNQYLLDHRLEAYKEVRATIQFHLDEKRWGWNHGNSDSWTNLDPLTTSQMLVRVREQYEALLSDPMHVASIKSHYESQLFKCTYLFCSHSRRGFETKDERETHVKNHGRPWKCSLPSCDFSAIGYNSKKRRDEHWMKVHLPTARQPQGSGGGFESLDPEEVQPLLFGFIIEDDIQSVQQLRSSPGGKRLKAEVVAAARLIAAQQGSLAMTKLLAPAYETCAPSAIVESALAGQDVDFVKWALSQANQDDCSKFMKVVLGTKSEEIYALWEDYIHNLLLERENLPFHMRLNIPLPLLQLFKRALFTDVKDNLLKESRMKHTLRKLAQGSTTTLELGAILVRIAKSSCSLSLAQEVLELGANVDQRGDFGRDGLTALQAAAKKTTQEAAILMDLLISKGAATIGKHSDGRPGKDIGTEKGAAEIAKWLGMTWDELLDSRRETEVL